MQAIRCPYNADKDALSNEDSKLAQFLLVNNKRQQEADLFGGAMKSFRNMAIRFITGKDEVNEIGSLRSNKAWFNS